MNGACSSCLRRSWLLSALAAHVGKAGQRGAAIAELLELGDLDLIAALGGSRAAVLRASHEAFDAAGARRKAVAAGLDTVCRHEPGWPDSLAALASCGAIHVAGGRGRFLGWAAGPCVAVVGSRACSGHGRTAAHALGRGLAAAGVPVVSGMAFGVDAAAHDGALSIAGPTIAVLAGGADLPYPRSKQALHARLRAGAVVVSELPPGTPVHRWMFPARNRLIAALSELTVVVEARERSGSLITSALAQRYGRGVAAMPGRPGDPNADGTNALLFDGAGLVRGPRDALDLVLGVGVAALGGSGGPLAFEGRLGRVLDAVRSGAATPSALLAAVDGEPPALLAALGELELLGAVRRSPAGAYEAIP